MCSTPPPRPHPLGVRPLGNAFAEAAPRDIRSESLGPYFRRLPDALLVSLLGQCPADALNVLALVSKALYAFARDDELWRALVLSTFGVNFDFCGSWRRTYVVAARAAAAAADVAATSRCDDRNPHCTAQAQARAKAKAKPNNPSRFATDLRKPAAPIIVQVRGLYSDVLFHKWRCQSAEMHESWLQFDNARRIDARSVTVEQFQRDFEAPGVPVVISGIVETWPAFKKWSKQYFRDQFGNNVCFSAGGYPFPMQKYIEFSEAVEGRCDQPLYLFDKDFARKAPQLADDYQVPRYFDEDLFQYVGRTDVARPAYRWLIAGPRNSGSSFHKDPNGTSAWNACVRGSKKWIFFPPEHPPPGVHPSSSESNVTAPISVIEWYLNFYDAAREAGSRVGSVECTVHEGDLVFVPSGWWHAVINLEWSAAVTQNYVSSVNFGRVARWLAQCSDQISGCVSEAHAEEVARTFVPRVLEARPELQWMLNKRQRGDHDMPSENALSSEALGNPTKVKKASSTERGLWERINSSSKDEGDRFSREVFSFGVG